MQITIVSEDFNVQYVESLEGVELEDDKFFTFDTETTGLHIKKDRPFLAAICTGHKVYVFPPTAFNIWYMHGLSKQVKRVYGHNVSYDMHMIANTGYWPLHITNWGDTMCLARLSFEAISTRDGGDSLALKKIAKKYIDSTSDQYEHTVKQYLTLRRKNDKQILTAMLKPFGWSASKYEKADAAGEMIPGEVWATYWEWKENYPEPTYQDVPLDIMIPYLAVDVILTRLLVLKALPVVVHRKQQQVMEREFKVLPVVWKMERAGIKVDREYLLDCRSKLAKHIEELYQELYKETGESFSVGQHKEIKKYYTALLGEEPESTDKKFLKKMDDRVATLITRIRRFEKWLATYIDRILEVSEYDGRFYTQMNQFNPVSGRFSGDAQQFPKDPIYTEEGYEFERTHKSEHVPSEYVLYHPRRPFTGRLYYLDYSQVELRVQGHYTLLFGGDHNLLRAYMPYKCHHRISGAEYNWQDQAYRKQWSEADTDGRSVWLDENGEPWTPTDVHSATTLKALVAMGFDPSTMDPELIKWWRKKGKTFNFMRNYGGGDVKAAETLEIELEQAKALNQGYTDAFPVVVTYQNEVVKAMAEHGYVENLYGRRYYINNSYRFYKAANYLIQGSCSDFLKEKMIQVDDFLTANNLQDKLKMVLCIHDELQFEAVDESVEWAIWEIKRIMEDTEDILVPIVAEVERTTTDWSSKEELEGVVHGR